MAGLKRLLVLMGAFTLVLFILTPVFTEEAQTRENEANEVYVEDGIALNDDTIVEYGESYYTKDEVALYLYAFVELPPNYISKNDAMDLGWDSRLGNLWQVSYGAAIGGSRFGNYEGHLPKSKGRRYYECDVFEDEYDGGYRGPCRIVFSNDGLIYYTGDHYETFELLYESWYEPDARYVETN